MLSIGHAVRLHTNSLRRYRVKHGLSLAVITLALSTVSVFTGPAAHADLPTGYTVFPPNAHIISDRKINLDYLFLFKCDNSRIRYIKATLVSVVIGRACPIRGGELSVRQLP
jgi:hypothetical protein